MSAAHELPILVSDHAMWQAADRFPWFDTAAIEDEVRAALAAGRLSKDRAHLGLHRRSDPASLYVWTENTERIYALRVDQRDQRRWVVTTTMRRGHGRHGTIE